MGTARRETYTFSPGFSRADESSPDAAGTAALSRAWAPISGRTHSRAPGPSQRKENSSRGPRQLLRVRLRYRTGRLAAPVSATPGSGIWTRFPFDRHGGDGGHRPHDDYGLRLSLRTD
ncbi:collagen alpha-1(I) chain [Labeo rohita]|uniref:Collagen alpha-1(I) chain n=1 Tax=Labeo rohita TaxID=84645 RepID=A0A498P2L8_LABRO|nr:collagen alpha-1(I) chain [Labeo rohita]